MSAEEEGGGWEIARRRWVISGRVQGVGFRAFATRVGRALRLAGGAANLADGRVEVVAEGPAHALDRLEAALGEGPRLARVDHVAGEALEPGAPTPPLDVEF